ncbi:MAG: hypothetical protein V1799_15980 [bacterium]
MEHKIPDNYRRSLSKTAQRAEQSLHEIELLLEQPATKNITKIVHQSYTSAERESLLKFVRELLHLNAIMFKELHLEQSVMDERHIIESKLAHLWMILVDSKAEKMKGYGGISDEAKEKVNLHVNAILKKFDERKEKG